MTRAEHAPPARIAAWVVTGMLFAGTSGVLAQPLGDPAIVSQEEPSAVPNRDPWEPMNRKVFWFNEQVDRFVLEPTARGWDWVAPDAVKNSVSNFFSNLRFPIVFANDLMQGKLRDASTDVGRFAINTTVGLAGFLDPATSFGFPGHPEDFGQTLGRWGVGPGPYLVLPILGPSNPRDTLGLVGDVPLSVTPFFVDQFILLGARVADVVNERALALQDVEEARRASFDFYVFARNAYAQRRQALIHDMAEVNLQNEEDLYFPEDLE